MCLENVDLTVIVWDSAKRCSVSPSGTSKQFGNTFTSDQYKLTEALIALNALLRLECFFCECWSIAGNLLLLPFKCLLLIGIHLPSPCRTEEDSSFLQMALSDSVYLYSSTNVLHKKSTSISGRVVCCAFEGSNHFECLLLNNALNVCNSSSHLIFNA